MSSLNAGMYVCLHVHICGSVLFVHTYLCMHICTCIMMYAYYIIILLVAIAHKHYSVYTLYLISDLCDTQIVGGYYHVLALTDDGKLFSWGCNNNGQLGTGNTTNSNVPVQIGSEFGR